MAFFRKKKKKQDDDDKPRNKKRRDDDDDDDEDDDEDIEEEDFDLVMFGGATNGAEIDMSGNARLAQAGLIPAKRFVTDHLQRRAERFRIEPKGKAAVVRMYVDGIKYAGGRMPGREALAVVQMLKLLAGLDIKERTITQKGGIFAEIEKTKYVLSLVVSPTEKGPETLEITVTNLNERLEGPEELGFPNAIQEAVRKYSAERKGLLVACGRPGSGTTSTRFGILRSIDAFIYSVYSLADTSNRDTTIITNYEVVEGDDFETTVTKIKRLEGDVILLDPVDDASLAKDILRLQEQLCFVIEISAADAAAGIMQLIKWAEDPKAVVDGLDMIVSQKLIRTLCNKCKDAFRPSPKLVKKAGLPPETRVLYRQLEPPEIDEEDEEDEEEYIPCKKCDGLGFYGRTAVYEMIEMTDSMKELILSDTCDANAIRKQARKEGMVVYQKEAIRIVAEGKTSLEELQRSFRKK